MARVRSEAAMRVFRKVDNRQEMADALEALGTIAEREGDEAQAETHYGESLRLRREIGEPKGVAEMLERLARRAPPAQAARLWGAADALRDGLGIPQRPSRLEAELVQRARVREAMGSLAYDAALRAGRTLDWLSALEELTTL